MEQAEESQIEINEQFKKALDLLERTGKNIFITGKAGTGKSTLLQYFRKYTKKAIVVLAPTGVAAVNIDGMTIHAFFHFKPDITKEKVARIERPSAGIYQSIGMIIIDEISMVRADLLDCVDKFLRLNGKNKNKPFGGVQMVFIGDLYQLPPVVVGKEMALFRSEYKSQYFFDAHVCQQESFQMEFIELEKIYRQKDEQFIRLLNAIRNKSATDHDIDAINKRVMINFEPKENECYLSLTTTKALSEEINRKELAKIKEKMYMNKGVIEGKFEQSHLPTEIELQLKVGAQIMLVNNDIGKRWVNGTVGKIIEIEERGKKVQVQVELPNGATVKVKPHTWDVSRMFYSKEKGGLDSEIMGSFTQLPLRLAWSVTIHKGQGKTFDNVIIDIGYGTFTHGQVYVALSRCTTLEGIVLRKPIQKKHIFMDWKIVNFLTKHQYKIAEKKMTVPDKIKMIEEAIKENAKLEITYLKASDEKSHRIIKPSVVGEMEYQGRSYIGVEGYCFKRKDDRVFRVDRILELKKVEEKQK